MSYSDLTLKRLFIKSGNLCAMPKCNAPLLIEEAVVGDICHIKARRKSGPRYDPALTLAERNDSPNLILLCPTCHKRVDSAPSIFTVELLTDMKVIHEQKAEIEISDKTKRQIKALIESQKPKRKTTANAIDSSVAVAIGGDNFGHITIKNSTKSKVPKSKYPSNSIGSDANLSGYIEYLVDLANKYWANVPDMSPGRIGAKIKRKFRLEKRTRLHLGTQRFDEFANYLISEILYPSPVGKMHRRRGTKVCRTFEEWFNDPR
jgi:hypothetical protein